MPRFGVADLHNSGLLGTQPAPAGSALGVRPQEVPLGYVVNRHILIDNLFGPDLFSGSLERGYRETAMDLSTHLPVVGRQETT
jgi:hypothetical protein